MGEITGAVWRDKHYNQTNVYGAVYTSLCLLRSICLSSSPSDQLILQYVHELKQNIPALKPLLTAQSYFKRTFQGG